MDRRHRLGGTGGSRHEAESYWFSEGVARYFAREILFRVRVVEPDELRDSVAADLATVYTSPRKAESNAALAARVESDGTMALLLARGSLYALGVNARIRGHSPSTEAQAEPAARSSSSSSGRRRFKPFEQILEEGT